MPLPPSGQTPGPAAEAEARGTDAAHAAHAKQRELEAEQQHVDRAYVRLEAMRGEAQALMREGYKQAQVGTMGSLVERDTMVFRAELWARTLDAADDGLVFGRLDRTDREVWHIGRIGVRDADSEILVVDWRAPAAEAFYQATPEDPRGIVRRRVLHCRGHQVVDIEDDLLDPDAAPDDLVVVGDGAFLAALSRTRDGSMRDIVATIQQEQDDAIRAPADGSVIVRGGPGTGKTAVALHRVAYLLFRHRQRFGSRGVLVVGPNPRFTAYIERVLPSLGEGGAVLHSLGDMVDGTTAAYHDTAAVARLKGATAMVPLLRRAVLATPAGAPHELRIKHRGTEVVLDSGALRRIRNDLLQRARRGPNGQRVAAAKTVLAALWERLASRGAARSEKEAFLEDVAARDEFAVFLNTWWPLVRPVDILRGLADPARLDRAARGRLSRDQIRLLAGSWERTARTGEVSFLDVALLDEIDTLIGPLPRVRPRTPGSPAEDNPYVVDGYDIFTGEAVRSSAPADEISEVTTYADRMARAGRGRDRDEDQEPDEFAHIVVDEAQDLAPMQWRMLKRRGKHATWTIVEDPAQSAWEDLDASAAAMSEALGDRRRHEFTLTTNYRNPAEIAAVAARVLVRAVPGAKPSRAVREGGERPHLLVVGDKAPLAGTLHAVVARMLGEVEGTIGIVTPVGETAEAAAALAGLPSRVQVMDALDAKGLEFDAAVIVDPKTIVDQSPAGLRTLYVALTRATRSLVVATGDGEWAAELLGLEPAEPVAPGV
ncbi:UvrD-helicase domain-containing protein [Yinghuangia soli]|uniref:AAA family ATPase n=1 Tax=Yinghuangia soli TaxID=2908204 RepID=A0AA41PXW7_9ACTN|nr:UvrD-helicase domain-containing protein [Yinghuangia soli]MCF2527617.1 AAA family ATPase [Yinghuangia soli]